MLRNVPNSWSRDTLVELLDSKGLKKLYDFVYVPVNIRTELNAGYAFVNMITPDAAKLFAEAFHGFSGRDPTVDDDCAVCVSEVQGLSANIAMVREKHIRQIVEKRQCPPFVMLNHRVVSFLDLANGSLDVEEAEEAAAAFPELADAAAWVRISV